MALRNLVAWAALGTNIKNLIASGMKKHASTVACAPAYSIITRKIIYLEVTLEIVVVHIQITLPNFTYNWTLKRRTHRHFRIKMNFPQNTKIAN